MKDDASVFSDGMTSLFSSGSSKLAGGSGSPASKYNASFDKVIKLLLKQYPQAAQTPHGKSGRLPLALAVRAGNRRWGDGMKALLKAYPPALFSGSKGLIPVKLYAHVLCLIGGGPRQQRPEALSTSNALAPDSAHSVNSNASSNWSTSRHGKKIGFLHNLLVSKQRHIRERMALYTPPTSSTGRQRKSQGLFASNSSHAKKRGLEKKMPSTISGATSSKGGSSRKSSNEEKKIVNFTEPKKVDPRRATTIFEILRTKPELVEVGQRYVVEREQQRQQDQFPRSERRKGLSSNSSPEIETEGRKKTRHKKSTMSRKIFEMITVFER